jgi:hypothetical protein
MTERVLLKLKNHRVSFLNGDAGPLAIGALLHHIQGAEAVSQECTDRYICTCCTINYKEIYTVRFFDGFSYTFLYRHAIHHLIQDKSQSRLHVLI